MNDYKMTPELRATWGLGTVFSLRMLGMFMVLPVRPHTVAKLGRQRSINRHCDRHLRGLAQAIFQIPRTLSDRVAVNH